MHKCETDPQTTAGKALLWPCQRINRRGVHKKNKIKCSIDTYQLCNDLLSERNENVQRMSQNNKITYKNY